ncbi:hypothetical protein [Paenibacillus luteus]|uniref:hypothetical protein n=1 Tax=Paenibacillus luteus TaxID=2545753 RepID=UPI001F4FFCF0|nr:hypothetical protein [Paenibacillus luteus]
MDKEALEKYQRDYAKLWISPFYHLFKRTPPIWYNRIILEAMIDVYRSWHETMLKSNEPFYLKIWLYDPDFIQSQIVVAYRENLHFYENTFDAPKEVNKTFPYHPFTYLREKLLAFDWKLHLETEVHLESDLIDHIQHGWSTATQAERIRKRAYRTETITQTDGTPDIIYCVEVGNVWVGTLQSS